MTFDSGADRTVLATAANPAADRHGGTLMTTINTSSDRSTDACAVDRSCADSGCGCATPAAGSDSEATTSRKGLKAGLLAAACVIGCLAVPVAIGGVVAVSGALAGEAWLLVGVAVAAIVVGVAVVRRRSTGKVC